MKAPLTSFEKKKRQLEKEADRIRKELRHIKRRMEAFLCERRRLDVGSFPTGAQCGDIEKFIRWYRGETRASLAKEFGVCYGCMVVKIKRGKEALISVNKSPVLRRTFEGVGP